MSSLQPIELSDFATGYIDYTSGLLRQSNANYTSPFKEVVLSQSVTTPQPTFATITMTPAPINLNIGTKF